MPFLTRFNPTANGGLHIGHAYIALLNWGLANSVPGGKFIMRIDDVQEYLHDRFGSEQVHTWADTMLVDLEWLGITPDKTYRQSERTEEVQDFIKSRGFIFQGHQPRCPETFPFAPGTTLAYYTYTPRYTLEKVVLDYMDGITHLVRGFDLITEFSLYAYFCQALDLPLPEQHFAPRLTMKRGGTQVHVSKSLGGNSLAELREAGVPFASVIRRLALSCLVDPYGYWTLGNLKASMVYDETQW